MGGSDPPKARRREQVNRPELILSARDSTASKIENLEAGADDYLTEALRSRRARSAGKGLAAPRSGQLRLGSVDRTTCSPPGQEGRAPDRAYAQKSVPAGISGGDSRTMIMEHVWHQSFEGLMIHSWMSMSQALRASIDDPFPKKLIRTVRGVGYRLAEGESAMPTMWSTPFSARRLAPPHLLRPYSTLREPSSSCRYLADLESTILETQSRRARQIAETLVDILPRTGEAHLKKQIETLYAPELGDRFIRVTRPGGSVLYRVGGARRPELCIPASVAPVGSGGRMQGTRMPLRPDGRTLLVASQEIGAGGGASCYCWRLGNLGRAREPARETPPHSPSKKSNLNVLVACRWRRYRVRRALAPVEDRARKAAIITQHNLSERLPVPEMHARAGAPVHGAQPHDPAPPRTRLGVPRRLCSRTIFFRDLIHCSGRA